MTVFKKPAEQAPCMLSCPAGIDIPRYVRYISKGEFTQAFLVIRERIPFPSVCGYICVHPCEKECSSKLISKPIAIRALKRFVAEKSNPIKSVASAKKTGKKVAIVGAGPAGLTAAYYLNHMGHDVTIFEASPEPGGMMRWGVPAYRLPRNILDSEIKAILDGINLKTNTPLKSLNELKDFNATFIAIGAQFGTKLDISGANLPEIQDAIVFLRRVNSREEVKIKGSVCVIGGGNVAIDAARTARRLGAEKVTIIYRRRRDEMPASEEEINGAIEEGVEIVFQAMPDRASCEDGKVVLQCLRTKPGETDASGRAHPVPVKGSEFKLDCNMIIAAIGQTVDISGQFGLTGRNGYISVDEKTLETSRKGIFSGGDAVSGPASVIEAIAAGRKAAASIDKYLGGSGDISEKLLPAEGDVESLLPDLNLTRAVISNVASAERVKDFREVELVLSEEAAVNEAKRCLRCDLPIQVDTAKCVGCLTCELICSLTKSGRFARNQSHIKINRIRGGADYQIEFDKDCLSCGICARYCTHNTLVREKAGVK